MLAIQVPLKDLLQQLARDSSSAAFPDPNPAPLAGEGQGTGASN